MNEVQDLTERTPAAPELFLTLFNGELAAWVRPPHEHGHTLFWADREWCAVPDLAAMQDCIEQIYSALDEAELHAHLIYDQAALGLVDRFADWGAPRRWRWQWLHWERISAGLGGAFLTGYVPLSSIVEHVLPRLEFARIQQAPDTDVDMATEKKDSPLSVAETPKPKPEGSPAPMPMTASPPADATAFESPPALEGQALLAFLPALFVQPFSVVNGADLALLIGQVEPLSIPSPYPEPSKETLRRKQRAFRTLPKVQQRQIVDIVRDFMPRLRLRPEMQELVWQLLHSAQNP